METTTLRLEQLQDEETAARVRQALDGEPGVNRVLLRADRNEVYIRHSRAKVPRHRLIELLEGEGLQPSVKTR